ncbi:MAG: hypothetical protein IPJ52_05760 [Rhodocyclaceae bacterium]|nr:hypothetical protein [Rhodocyclaceae bacterium]
MSARPLTGSPLPGVDQPLEQASPACGMRRFRRRSTEGLGALVDAIRADLPVNAGNVQQLSGPILSLLVSPRPV